MRRKLRVDRAAEVEIAEAFEWYESRRPGLGHEFVATLDSALTKISRDPESWPSWSTNARFRRFVVDRFPYALFFRVTATEAYVAAVAHARRRPGYWISRR